MNISLHKNARTTPAIRKEIQEFSVAERERAQRYGLSRATVHKWKHRQSTADASHRPHTLPTTLTPAQELIVVALRNTLLLPVDDLLAVVRAFINAEVSRAGLERCLERYDVSSLKALRRVLEPPQRAPKKPFKNYEPGFIQLDIKYWPRMQTEDKQRYLYVAIDRATRWVYLEVRPDKEASSAAGFLERVVNQAPFMLSNVLTDKGKEFTDRFSVNGERTPTGHHLFDQACVRQRLEQRLLKPYHSQTKGMVERFNGRLSEILATTHFENRESLEETLMRYTCIYNNYIPQPRLDHVAPIQALESWYKKRPELFKNGVYNHPGPDTYCKFSCDQCINGSDSF
jgi:transposase-like protein